MSNLTTFNFNSNELRVVELNSEPWFVAKDVCEVLGVANPSSALKLMDKAERARFNLGLRGLGNANIISESGLYKLIMRSDKPQARPFQDWVTKVVLPTIRKDGGYIADEEKIIDEDELIIKAMNILHMKVTRLNEEKVIAEGQRDAAIKTIAKVNRTLREVCRKLPNVNLQKTKEDLMKLGYLYRPDGGCYQVNRTYSYLFSERIVESKGWNVISPTEEGIRLLISLYVEGKLTLKKGFTPDNSISV